MKWRKREWDRSRGAEGGESGPSLWTKHLKLLRAWKQSQGPLERVWLKHTRFSLKTRDLSQEWSQSLKPQWAEIKNSESFSEFFRLLSLVEPGGYWTELAQWTQWTLSRPDFFFFTSLTLAFHYPFTHSLLLPHGLMTQDYSSANCYDSSLP